MPNLVHPQRGTQDGSTLKSKPKRAKGEVVEVHGGRIVRSTGRKDRHSKVCTARGPRDRRVRLSPNTAIQFYDVQDRLGYDRPSKAIDWLMKEAKAAIDALDNSCHSANLNATILMQSSHDHLPGPSLHGFQHQNQQQGNCSKSAFGFQSQDFLNDISTSNCNFFSMPNGVIQPSSTEFQNYSHSDHLSSRNKGQAQGLCLSFHSFQDLSFLLAGGQQGLLPSSIPLHNEINSEMARCERFFTWNGNSSNAKEGEESLINSLPLHNFPSAFDQNQLPFQREPLQSSFSPPVRAPLNEQLPNLNYSGIRCSNDGLLGLSTAPRIQVEEEQNPIFNKPSSATSLLHYQD